MNDLLNQAARLLDLVDQRWARGSALLARIALEDWIREQSATLDADLPQATMRSQLLCLPQVVDAELAARTAFAWSELSAACHHHAYELSPAPAHLTALLAEVTALTGSRPPARAARPAVGPSWREAWGRA
ncbi:MAG: hypothetical protein WAW78_15620 [Propioniciclava sp.]